jgi:hypothetical protein
MTKRRRAGLDLSAGLAWAASIAVFAVGSFRLLHASAHQLRAQFDLDYESPVIATIEAVQRGVNVYAPSHYMEPPFGLHMYTPLYHYVVSIVTSPAGNPFLAGRIVSLACMVLAGTLLLLVAPSRSRWAGVMAVGFFFLFWPVTRNAALVRPDPMALLFSAAAVVLLARRPGDPRAIAGAALLCALAIATKQSFVAAPAACLLFVMHRDVRRGLMITAGSVLAGAVIIAGAEAASGGGFLYSITSGGRHPITLSELRWRFISLSGQPLAVAWAVVSLAATAVLVLKSGHRKSSPYALYAAMTWIVFFATAGKMGAGPNYYLEPMLASLMLGAWYVGSAGAGARRGLSAFALPAAAVVVLALVGFDMWRSKLGSYSFMPEPPAAAARIAHIAEGRRLLAESGPRPEVLNLAHAQHTWWLPGRVAMHDVYLYALMWRDGTLDEEPVVRSILRRDYTAIITTEVLLGGQYDAFAGASWNRVTEAALTAYPCRKTVEGFVLLLPREKCADFL